MAEDMSWEQIRERIEMFDAGEYQIFSPWVHNAEDRTKYMDKIMEQYALYQQTSENLVNHRQNVNSFYQALNGILVTLLAAIVGLISDDVIAEKFTMVSPGAAVVLISVLGCILDYSWGRLLESYGKLNSAKMKVLYLLEKQLPVEIYKTEWDVMSDRLNNKTYRSFTATEKWIPRLFCALYVLGILLGTHFMMTA